MILQTMKPTSLVFLLLAMLAGCKKNDTIDPSSGLPATSSSGKNILACRVNGQIHVYSGKASINNDNGVDYSIWEDYILIHGDNFRYNDDIRIRVTGNDSLKPGIKYVFSSETQHRALYTKYEISQFEYEAQSGSGWILFSRLDKDVAAGTFAFTAYLNGQQGSDSVTITGGRFDISRRS